MIDEMVMPFPLPPPPPKEGSPAIKINIDSLNKVKVKLIVDTTMFKVSSRIKLPEVYEEYDFLVKILNTLQEKTINTGWIKSEKGHQLIFGSSLEDYVGRYSQMVTISRIAFNSKLDQAILLAGHKTHELAGYVNLYLLKKENGKLFIKRM
ncbi:MAG: hypothetical protein RI572_00610 [Salegentibacter sp.]|uniref:hypothetical protein n=1 Tax=Salegentibacter sp. TaxID=1903072 RepID=UPI00287016D9|nr:hypothetical protein [Salegentibacter sp.]MDR9455883.1 hypothetical protein [Salegentibacter sp.]